MTKWLIFIIVVLILASGGLWWYNRSHKPVSPTNTTQTSQTKLTHFGAVVRDFALGGSGDSYKSSIDAQIGLLKSLGATDSRANIETLDAVNDYFVNQSIAAGLVPTLIVEPPQTLNYQDAYNFSNHFAARYKGKVMYYQLANEASGATIKANYPGNNTSDYDEVKYQAFKTMVGGLSEGIYAADPTAQRIISAHWLGTGVIDKLMADKIHFDIIGWDWYSDMGDDLIKTVDGGKTLNIPEYLSKYNKPVWVVETNLRQSTKDGHLDDQANFLQKFVTNVASHNNVSGMFVFTLTDLCGALNADIGNMGLVKITQVANGTCTIGAQKPAFATYQTLIKQLK